MSRKPEPLDPAILALLASERAIASQPEEIRRRAFARARDALARGAALPQRSIFRKLLGGRPLAAIGVGIAAAVAWAAVRDASREPASTPASVGSIRALETPASGHGLAAPVPLETPPPAAPAPLEAPPEAAPAPAEAPELAIPHAAKPAPRRAAPIGREASGRQPARADSYDAELRVLERARSAVARRDFTEALAAIARHSRQFPLGKLAEEREALRVRALIGLGFGDEARRAAAAFREDFPASALWPRVEEMLHAAP